MRTNLGCSAPSPPKSRKMQNAGQRVAQAYSVTLLGVKSLSLARGQSAFALFAQVLLLPRNARIRRDLWRPDSHRDRACFSGSQR